MTTLKLSGAWVRKVSPWVGQGLTKEPQDSICELLLRGVSGRSGRTNSARSKCTASSLATSETARPSAQPLGSRFDQCLQKHPRNRRIHLCQKLLAPSDFLHHRATGTRNGRLFGHEHCVLRSMLSAYYITPKPADFSDLPQALTRVLNSAYRFSTISISVTWRRLQSQNLTHRFLP